MNILLQDLVVHTRQTTEHIDFSETVTFLYGPIGKGKSTVARLIDYCLGGELERTPAIQYEFVSAELFLMLGRHACIIERSADENQGVRVTWTDANGVSSSINAPFSAQEEPIIGGVEVYNLSDLIFHLCEVTPIKVRKRTRDPDSPLIRLSVRDIWWYCYLDQTHLDSSFFRLEDPFRGRKSQDAMRFFTGLHSERLSQLEDELMSLIDEQRGKREAVQQIRSFMERFNLGTEKNMVTQLQVAETELAELEYKRRELEKERSAQTHPTERLREKLRQLSAEIEDFTQAISASDESIAEQRALRAELITAKTKAERVDHAGKILQGVSYQWCPECGTNVSDRPHSHEHCRLCWSEKKENVTADSLESEALRRDLNERIDEIADSISRREQELRRMERQLLQSQQMKASLDRQLEDELARYDSAFVESIRVIDRDIATLEERINSFKRLQKMPQAITELEEEAGALQGKIDVLRTAIVDERNNLNAADKHIEDIEQEFKRILLAVSFPGISEDDDIRLDPRNWKPTVVHGDIDWSFWDTGSGGKKTLFNVCYALAIHAVALERGMPVPNVLIIDSPTKNISEDMNPELVQCLYNEIYLLANKQEERNIQFLLIDSEIVRPIEPLPGFLERRMAGEPNAPSLISYYVGP